MRKQIIRTQLFALIAALFILAGLIGTGWFVAQAMKKLKTHDHFVTVKGSAEKEVDADLVIWALTHNVTGSTLADVQERLDKNTEIIHQFFINAGFNANEIAVSAPRLIDRWAYIAGEQRPAAHFSNSITVILRTHRVADVLAALRRMGQLVSQGVQLDANRWPEFKYTHLNDIKPALIAEATVNAGQSAQQFAKDSKSQLAGIRSANLGQVSITDRDQGSPQVKTVRVVSMIDYFLKD